MNLSIFDKEFRSRYSILWNLVNELPIAEVDILEVQDQLNIRQSPDSKVLYDLMRRGYYPTPIFKYLCFKYCKSNSANFDEALTELKNGRQIFFQTTWMNTMLYFT